MYNQTCTDYNTILDDFCITLNNDVNENYSIVNSLISDINSIINYEALIYMLLTIEHF